MAERKQGEPTTEAWNGDWILPTYRSLQEKIQSSVASPSQLAHEDFQFPLPKQINDYVFEVCKPEGRQSIDIVFCHGLQLEYPRSKDPHITTWMSRNKSKLWLKWLVEDEYLQIPNARIFTICYDAPLRRTDDMGRMDMYLTVENLIHSLTESRVGVGQDGCPVVLVGHCFGGLLMKELCVRAHSLVSQPGQLDVENLKNFLRSVKGFFTYSSPHHGIRLADHSTWSGKGPLFEDLSTHNEIASRRNEEFRKLRKEKAWKVFGVAESLPVTLEGLGFEGMVVEEASARHDVDDFYTVPNANHFDVCRPKSTTCNSFELLRKFVFDVVEKDKAGVSTNLLTDDQFNPIVDIDSRVEVVVKKLERNQRLGIVGFGGMGKTTLAKAVVDKISGRFEYVCFFEDVKSNMAEDEGLGHLRAQISKRLQWKGRSVDESFKWDKLKRKKVLICLDDAKYEFQVRVILESDDFSEESHVIVTSLQGDFLRNQGFETHDATGLDLRNSERLFCLHAFGQLEVPQNYKQHMSSFVRSFAKKCGGHPLALKVSRGYLSMYKEDEKLWDDALKKLSSAQSLSGDCKDKLWSIVTVEALAPLELEMFLDAATCFHGDLLELVQNSWAACSWGEGRSAWKNLLDRCLVSIDNGRIMMHDLLRDLGRKEAGRSRVCNVSDIMQLREEDKATVKVLKVGNPHSFGDVCYPYYQGDRLLPSAVWKLCALEYLEIKGESWLWDSVVSPTVGVVDVMLPTPRWFTTLMRVILYTMYQWSCSSPLDRTPDDQLEALRHLENTFCNLEVVPKSVGKRSALRCLSILKCCFLRKLPKGLGQLQALRYLKIEECGYLGALPDSIGNLRALKRLEIKCCSELKALPDSIGNLRALEHLEIIDCYSLRKLPKSIDKLIALEHLELVCQALEALPDSIGNLRALKRLEIKHCSKLKALPDSIGNLRALEHLEIIDCYSLRKLPKSIDKLIALEHLELVCKALEALPDTIGNLRALKRLEIKHCSELKALPDSIGNLQNLTHLEINCESLRAFPKDARELRKLKTLVISLHLKEFPEFVCQLEGLRHLELHGPYVKEPISFPDTLVQLHKLEKLIFRNMYRFTELLEFVVPEFVGQLRALQHLEFDSCGTLRNIPEFIAQLPELRHLKLVCSDSLETPPSSLLDKLHALQQLTIQDCKSITKAPEWPTQHGVQVDFKMRDDNEWDIPSRTSDNEWDIGDL